MNQEPLRQFLIDSNKAGYAGGEEKKETKPVYQFLRNALMRMPEDYPFRGPKEYREGEYLYTNSWEGGVEQFSGGEKIMQEEKLIYKANYLGGLVDRRGGV